VMFFHDFSRVQQDVTISLGEHGKTLWHHIHCWYHYNPTIFINLIKYLSPWLNIITLSKFTSL
jgi:hypothetical protein